MKFSPLILVWLGRFYSTYNIKSNRQILQRAEVFAGYIYSVISLHLRHIRPAYSFLLPG